MATEQRLIDANVAAEGIIDQLEIEWGYDGIREDVQRIFDSIPVVDAVEVVRCKDCEYGCEDHEDAYLCNNGFNGLIGFTRGDDFCSYGERRTDHV